MDDDDAPFGRYIEDGDSAKNTDVARPSTAGEVRQLCSAYTTEYTAE